MQGGARLPPACVSKVLDDDDLLAEIIVRVGFPTNLVRAAAVCRRWLSHASDGAFLRRFRELHPPRLLGFYIAEREYPASSRFFPMMHLAPELAAVVDAPGVLLYVYMLQNGDDVWHLHLTLASDLHAWKIPKGVLLDNKIYLATDDAILVLDLTSSILSTIQPPHGVSFDVSGTTILSRADDGSVLYLIHIKELQLQIWLHNGDNWLLVDTVCLSEMCANFLEDEPTADIRINHVGDYNEFVFLEMGRCVLYLDVKHRTLRKVYKMTADEYHLGDIYSFMMSWPPIFPTLGPARNAT